MIRHRLAPIVQLDTLDDIGLCKLARDGQRDALDALLRRHYERVFKICRRMCCSDADALDAAQETLINVTRRLDRFDGRSSFTTWLYRVTTNTCLDELRRRSRRPEPVDPQAQKDQVILRHLGETDRIDEQLNIDAALAQLPVEFRSVIVLRDVLGLDYDEIGRVLDLPPGTVRSRIARGRKRLAEWFGNQEPDQDRLIQDQLSHASDPADPTAERAHSNRPGQP